MVPSNVSEPKISSETASTEANPGVSAAAQSPEKAFINRRQSQTSLSHHSIYQAGPADEKAGLAGESRVNSSGTASTPGVQNGLQNSSLNSSQSSVQNQGILPQTSNPTPSSAGAGGPGKNMAGPSVINKQLLSKLNKSLKERQKTTSIREPQTKTPTLIQNVLSTSPQFSAASNLASNVSNSTIDQSSASRPAPLDEQMKPDSSEGDLLSTAASVQGKEAALKSKARSRKKAAKANSSRTDFFAAKLASAVDDVESSDSDETFVYETTAHEFGSENEDAPGASVGTNATPPENLGQAPASVQSVHDNISVAGSLRNSALESVAHSPTAERNSEEKDTGPYTRAESVHSLQSKPNIRSSSHATPPTTTMGNRVHNLSGLVPSQEYPTFSDPYLDTQSRHSRQGMRKSSSHSILSDERKEHLLRSPHSPYGGSRQTNPLSFGLSEHSQGSHKPFQDGLYSYGEEDVSGDEGSSHDDLNSICTEHHAHVPHMAPNIANGTKGSDSFVPAYKSQSDKTATTSSKLRSTTSKLFDKKGAQPRRYSTIPDDIDIEDFDDELIYYDNNNMRFPYNQGSLNESSSLLNGHKLPHHRSLNLNFSGKRAANHPRNTRYVSLGYAPPGTYSNMNKKSDVFSFPYAENQQNFYGFDEYDEDSQLQPEHESLHMKGRSGLSPENTRYLLPRKASNEYAGGEKLRIIKNVIYTLIGIICILSVGFVSGFLLASTKELTNVSILGINHATVSQDELVFNVIVEALNPGWFTVSLEELELDIFAKSGYLGELGAGNTVETVLLGSVSSFESALSFEGNFLNRQLAQQTGEIKLISPGKNSTGSSIPEKIADDKEAQIEPSEPNDPKNSPDNSDKWAVISKHPFDLILRGVIKYNLPWTSNVKSVVVDKVGYIDPSSVF